MALRWSSANRDQPFGAIKLIISTSHIASNNEHLRRVSEVLPWQAAAASKRRDAGGDEAGVHEAECRTPNEW